MLSRLSAVTVAVLVVAGSTACATKGFVRTGVKGVNDKVDALGQSVEATQERTRKNEGAIGDVDQKAQAAQSSADSARQAASVADAEAKAAHARANEVGTKADDLDKASRRLVSPWSSAKTKVSSSQARRFCRTKRKPSSTSS